MLLIPKDLLDGICENMLSGALAVGELGRQGASLKITSQKLSMLNLIRS